MRCYILPPHIADKLPAGHTVLSERIVERRRSVTGAPRVATGADAVSLYDARHADDTRAAVRTSRSDIAAAEVDDALNKTLQVYAELGQTFGRAGVAAYVHFGRDFDNAYWDGVEMVFGDGDKQTFDRFTRPADIGAHELTHGLTGDRLLYNGQAGALNESVSDCMGALVRQSLLGLAPSDPDGWLIGKGLLLEPGARALRDMLAPGSAYDTEQLGRDPQPADMAGYVKTTDDDGGVHINSGIPNRAFALASIALGSTRQAMTVWLRALDLLNNPSASFRAFANMTVGVAQESGVGVQVQQAWATVGVLPAPAPAPAPAPVPAPVPAPAPTPAQGACFPGASTAVADRVARAAARLAGVPVDQVTVEQLGRYQERHWRTYFGLR